MPENYGKCMARIVPNLGELPSGIIDPSVHSLSATLLLCARLDRL